MCLAVPALICYTLLEDHDWELEFLLKIARLLQGHTQADKIEGLRGLSLQAVEIVEESLSAQANAAVYRAPQDLAFTSRIEGLGSTKGFHGGSCYAPEERPHGVLADHAGLNANRRRICD